MILKRRVALGGEQLDELDDRIIITGIDEAAGKDTINSTAAAAGYGQRITARRRETLDVSVRFALNIKNNNMKARSQLLEKVNAWAANGGWLTLNYRPDRRLYVVLAQAPGEGDMFNWTNEFTMMFRAYSVPYWTNTAATSVSSGTKSSGSMVLDMPGNANSAANVTVQNKSGKTINKVTLTVNGYKMVFDNLALGGTASLVIDHVQTDSLYYLRARIGGTSVMAKRTGANDFIVKPGKNNISFSADRAVNVTVSAGGRYL